MVIMNLENLSINNRVALFGITLFLLVVMLFVYFRSGKTNSKQTIKEVNNQVISSSDDTKEDFEYHYDDEGEYFEEEYEELASDSDEAEMF